jgi:hypothetical protein
LRIFFANAVSNMKFKIMTISTFSAFPFFIVNTEFNGHEFLPNLLSFKAAKMFLFYSINVVPLTFQIINIVRIKMIELSLLPFSG